ncbi:MAG: SWIM zinc finger family protein [Bacillus sp. (in: Bacteria)]|nr:SWIM zinc finger family protein [Bacillus sp. (in: firmicutes)]
MKLTNFESYVADVILWRGEDYYHSGNVVDITEYENGIFSVEVEGSDDYTVEVHIKESNEILMATCDCPYDMGPICKHQVAAFFAIREMRNYDIVSGTERDQNANKKKNLPAILEDLEKDELVKLIVEICQRDTMLKKELLLRYAPKEDEVAYSKKLIRQYIDQGLRRGRGYIDWENIDDALEGARIVLKNAEEELESGDVKLAVSLGLAVLSLTVDMIDYADDSSGSVGYVIERSLDLIRDGAEVAVSLNENDHALLFQDIWQEAMDERYDDWSDWRFQLLDTCVTLCSTPEQQKVLEDQLNGMLKELVKNSSFYTAYNIGQLKQLQFKLIETFDGTDKARDFMYENLHVSFFREKAILEQMEAGRYKEVIRLCQEGENLEKGMDGLINKWKRYRYEANQAIGDVDEQRRLALEFVYNGEMKYYVELKRLHSSGEWPDVLVELLRVFEAKNYIPSIYEDIVIEEKMWDKLLDYCKRDVSSILRLYPYLKEEHFNEVEIIFTSFIQKEASKANKRSHYQGVCSIIRKCKKAIGEESTVKLVSELMRIYSRRPAFLDELRKCFY